MYPIQQIPLAVAVRIRLLLLSLRSDDRGDSPVPSAIIIAGLVFLAVAIVTWIYFLGQKFMDEAPQDLPDPPNAPGG